MTLSLWLTAILVALAMATIIPLLPELLLGWTRDKESAQGVVMFWGIAVILIVCFYTVYEHPNTTGNYYRHDVYDSHKQAVCGHLVSPNDEDGKCDACGGEI